MIFDAAWKGYFLFFLETKRSRNEIHESQSRVGSDSFFFGYMETLLVWYAMQVVYISKESSTRVHTYRFEYAAEKVD